MKLWNTVDIWFRLCPKQQLPFTSRRFSACDWRGHRFAEIRQSRDAKLIEIHLCRDDAPATFSVSSTGALCLTIGLGHNIEDELSLHREEIFNAVVLLYLQLFGDRDFPRQFIGAKDRIRIVPLKSENFQNKWPMAYWTWSARKISSGEASRPSQRRGMTSIDGRVSKLKYR